MTPKMKKEGFDFPISCIGIMADLWSKDGVTQKQLGSSMIKTKSSVTKMLESLESSKLIGVRMGAPFCLCTIGFAFLYLQRRVSTTAL